MRASRIAGRPELSQLNANIAVNLVGKAIVSVATFAFVPQYVRYLGVEAYGLVGFYAALQPIMLLVDLGLSTTLNRELARLSTQPDTETAMRDHVRTLEVVYWLCAVLMVAAFCPLAPLIAHSWIHAQHLERQTVAEAVALMGIATGLQFPFALYQGGLLGIQRQAELNVLLVVAALARTGGAVAVLAKVSPTIIAFFQWQIGVSAVTTVLGAALLWHSLPKSPARPRFHADVLRAIWRFAAGMAAIGITSVILTQLDKIVLSRILPLKEFGYYSLATLIASSMYAIVNPIFSAVFPRYSQLAATESPEMPAVYHKTCSLVSVLVLPLVVVLALFSAPVMLAWTGKQEIADRTHLILTILIVGNGMNAIMYMPFAAQLAHGWTRLTFVTNTLSVLVQAPALLFVAARYGAIGAATVWAMVNLVTGTVIVQAMHARILRGEKAAWYTGDVGQPLIAILAVTVPAALLLRNISGRMEIGLALLAVLGLATLAAALAAPAIRPVVMRVMARR